LDSLAEVCESISDLENAQRYKAEADHLAASFYGSSDTSKPTQDAAVSPGNHASSREASASGRDPASVRRFVGVHSPSSPPTDGPAAVSETAIRAGVATMISRLGLNTPGPDNVEDTLSVRQAERDLQETVTKTGGADAIGLSIPSQPTSSNTDLRENNLASDHHAGGRPSPSSKRKTSSLTITTRLDR